MSSTLITDYLSAGPLASRPATPNVPPGCTAIYFGIDTGAPYAWSGSAWAQVGAATPIPSVIQTAITMGQGITSATLPAAPTAGNLLIAVFCGAAPAAATGWTQILSDRTGTTYTTVYSKIAGTGESATQTPVAAANGGLLIYEIGSGATPSTIWAASNGTASSRVITIPARRTSGLIIGAVYNEGATDKPSSFSANVTADISAQDTVNNHALVGFHAAGPVVGPNTISVTYATAPNSRLFALYVA